MDIKRTTIYFAAALLATGGMATYATTPSAATTQTQEFSATPYMQLSNSQQVLVFMSQAEQLVTKGDSTFAKMHLNEALSAASRLPLNGSAESNAIHRVTLVTVKDGTLERQMLIAEPGSIREPLSISSAALPSKKDSITHAEVHYISNNWDKSALLVGLNNVLRAIETGKTNMVVPEFNRLHTELLEDNERQVSDRRAAQDNVALARALLQVGAYDTAKQALARADEHIGNIAQNREAPERLADIAAMRNEIADVNKTIDRHEPNMLKTIDAKLEKWWNALS